MILIVVGLITQGTIEQPCIQKLLLAFNKFISKLVGILSSCYLIGFLSNAVDSSEGYTVTDVGYVETEIQMGPNLEFLFFQFSVVFGLVGWVGLHAPRGIVKCLKSFRRPSLQKKKKSVFLGHVSFFKYLCCVVKYFCIIFIPILPT